MEKVVAVIICAAIIGAAVWGYFAGEQTSSVGVREKVVKREIEIKAEGKTLHYQEEIFWREENFSTILENQEKSKSDRIRRFKEFYGVNADNFSTEFNEKSYSILLRCAIHGQFSGSWYDFHWFLNPFGLDFIDDDFVKSERELSWQGSINGTDTTITLQFPFPIDHCHAHVWSQ